jgi:hypothetical protein
MHAVALIQHFSYLNNNDELRIFSNAIAIKWRIDSECRFERIPMVHKPAIGGRLFFFPPKTKNNNKKKIMASEK